MGKKIYILILLIFFVQDLFSQCAMCKAVAVDSAEADGGRLNMGIMYIMTIPYILLFWVFRKKIFSFWRELRDAKGDH